MKKVQLSIWLLLAFGLSFAPHARAQDATNNVAVPPAMDAPAPSSAPEPPQSAASATKHVIELRAEPGVVMRLRTARQKSGPARVCAEQCTLRLDPGVYEISAARGTRSLVSADDLVVLDNTQNSKGKVFVRHQSADMLRTLGKATLITSLVAGVLVFGGMGIAFAVEPLDDEEATLISAFGGYALLPGVVAGAIMLAWDDDVKIVALTD